MDTENINLDSLTIVEYGWKYSQWGTSQLLMGRIYHAKLLMAWKQMSSSETHGWENPQIYQTTFAAYGNEHSKKAFAVTEQTILFEYG